MTVIILYISILQSGPTAVYYGAASVYYVTFSFTLNKMRGNDIVIDIWLGNKFKDRGTINFCFKLFSTKFRRNLTVKLKVLLLRFRKCNIFYV